MKGNDRNLTKHAGQDIDVSKMRTAIASCSTPKQAKDIADKAAAIKRYYKQAGADLAKRNDIAEVEIEALAKCGELLSGRDFALHGGDRKSSSRPASLKDIGMDKDQSSRIRAIATVPKKTRRDYMHGKKSLDEEITRADVLAIAFALRSSLKDASGDIWGAVGASLRNGMGVADAIREAKRAAIKERVEGTAARTAKEAAGVFDVLVIDPPWAMEKIERNVRPNQSEFDYPTMTEEELEDWPGRAARDGGFGPNGLPCADSCHVWVWTTHRFLPAALRLLDAWQLKYVCTFVWHKPGGFQPIGLPQYNCEFALYARRGTPEFIDTKALPTCFEAPRGAHSQKPEQFYAMVRRVTAGRRLDIFNRRRIEGFDGWGNEVPDAAE